MCAKRERGDLHLLHLLDLLSADFPLFLNLYFVDCRVPPGQPKAGVEEEAVIWLLDLLKLRAGLGWWWGWGERERERRD